MEGEHVREGIEDEQRFGGFARIERSSRCGCDVVWSGVAGGRGWGVMAVTS